MMTPSRSQVLFSALNILFFRGASSFGVGIESALLPLIRDASVATSPLLHNIPTVSIASAASTLSSEGAHIFNLYKRSLSMHPLPTKMITGGILAVVGDALAQSQAQVSQKSTDESENAYDTNRALSFASFDMCYRALQQFSFPTILQQCQGQYLNSFLLQAPSVHKALSLAATTVASGQHDLTFYLSAMEQTVTFQFGIVPTIYYPVFFALTGFVQGLTTLQSIERAKEKFIPLMQRNILFWIPVQFFTFSFVGEDLQIPLLCLTGLVWTTILSILAGGAKDATVVSTDDSELDTILSEIDPDYVSPDASYSYTGTETVTTRTVDKDVKKQTLYKRQKAYDIN